MYELMALYYQQAQILPSRALGDDGARGDGTPVVASSLGGIRDIVDELECPDS